MFRVAFARRAFIVNDRWDPMLVLQSDGDVTRFTSVIDAILATTDRSSEAEWGTSVVRAACELVRCDGAELTIRTRAAPRTYAHGTVVARLPQGGVVRVTSTSADGAVRIVLACHLRDDQAVPRTANRWETVKASNP